MKKDFIYIRICDGMNLSKTKIILKDKCNKVVFESFSEEIGKIRIPICDREVYKLIIISKANKFIVPLIAKKNETYCINIGSNNPNSKKHLITIWLMDANYPNIRIKGGEIIIWQDIQSQ